MKVLWVAALLVLELGTATAVCGWAQQGVPGSETGQAVGATEEGEALESGAEEATPLAILFRWVNFAILFGGLGYLLRKPAREFFEARHTEIRSGLERSRRAQEDAAKRMGDIESRLSQLSVELGEIRSAAEASAQSEGERIVADAKIEAARAVARSEVEIGRLARGMERQIREHIADQVIARAEARLRAGLSDDDRERMVRQAVAGL